MTVLTKTFRGARFAKTARRAVIATSLIAITACQMQVPNNGESIGFRQERYAQVAAANQFRDCRDEALEIDTQARASGQSTTYLRSAQVLERCETDLGTQAEAIPAEERMQAYALSIQNYLKGGDIRKARTNLGNFKSAFAGRDLYFPDRSSFVDNMELILGIKPEQSAHQLSVLNANSEVKSEMRRLYFWKEN